MKRLFLLLLLLPLAASAAAPTVLNASYVKETQQITQPSNAWIANLGITGRVSVANATVSNNLASTTITNSSRADFGSNVFISGGLTNLGAARIVGELKLEASLFAPNATITANGSSGFQFNGRSIMYSGADGFINFANNANNGFTKLAFGSSSAAFPALGLSSGDLVMFGGNGVAAGSTNKLILPAGVMYPTNSILPNAAQLGVGGYWIGNSNGNLVTLYSLNGTTTTMKVLAP